MPRAYSLIRPGPAYRAQAFVEGLRKAGYEVLQRAPGRASPGDIVVTWNRYGSWDAIASSFEAQGGRAVVAENGYIDPERYGRRWWYALALHGHNGQGKWPEGYGRWDAVAPQLHAEVKPWRADGGHVLVCPNRPFGRPGFIIPAYWAEKTAAALRKITKRPARIRPHPGNDKPAVPLERDLEGCWAVVVWASSAGVAALLAGIPVICMGPAWILKGAAGRSLEEVDNPPMPERLPHLERMAWAMWNVDEIASGEPFRRLLAGGGA